MKNSFNISEQRLIELLKGYDAWLKSDPQEARYPEIIREQTKEYRQEFLDKEILKQLKDDELHKRIFNYSRKLEGRVYRTLPDEVIKRSIKELRHNLEYLLSSDDAPALIAQNIIEAKYKIKHFSKAFWSPILQAQFPGVLPNWNNKTEDFLAKLGIAISTNVLSTAEKYQKISEAFTYLSSLISGHDFYTINHLMHYGTAIKEGSDLIARLQGRNIPDPIAEMISSYKDKIRKDGLKDELYKWQLTKKYKQRPDTEAEDFYTEYKSIDYSNLIYHNAKGVGNHLAKDRTEKFREQFQYLFDESIDLQSRITRFDKETLSIYREIWSKETDSHHQDERTISAYLAYYDANKYPIYKDSYYRKFCYLLEENIGQRGNKYIHYIELLDSFIENYILPDKELLELKASLIPDDGHEDASHYILAQDILYQILDHQQDNEEIESVRYWLYAPGENAEMWDEFYNTGIIGLGWDKLGDLSQYHTKGDIVKKLQEIGETTSSKKNDSTANFEFKEVLSIGDVVIVKRGRSELLGYGVVNSDYYYDETRERYQKCRKVEWKKKGVWPTHHSLPVKTLTDITEYDTIEPEYAKYYEYLMAVINDEYELLQMRPEEQNISLNTILFGPPGTGKTYNTVDLAVKIAAPGRYNETDHSQNKIIYDALVRDGQIVFSTFHQSMCYEDFIEGIKPSSDESTGLTYSVEDGIFKQISINAAFEFVGERSTDASKSLSFSYAYDKLLDEVTDKTGREEGYILKLKSGSELEIVEITSGSNFLVQHKNGSRTYTVSRRRLEKLFSELPDLDIISNINEEIRNVIGGSNSSAYWAVLRKLRSYKGKDQPTVTSKKFSYEDKAAAVEKLLPEDVVISGKEKNNVLIIDEINRGNVSQVFGELITLLEEDKRFGNEEGLSAILPYSRSRFFVPPNLYIIGTMNTADRSVEALDTALRRRFSFLEMMPRYDLEEMDKVIAGVQVSDLLETINNRIEKLIDRDHMIGHSYFLRLENSEELMQVFCNKVIPLLQEYFYGNYEKMGHVLGRGFINKLPDEKVTFANFHADENDFNDRVIYRIDTESLEDLVKFETAISLMMNRKE